MGGADDCAVVLFITSIKHCISLSFNSGKIILY